MRDLGYAAPGRDLPGVPTVVIGFDTFGHVYGAEVLRGLMAEAQVAGVRTVIDRSPAPDRDPSAREWVMRHVGAGAAGAVLVTAPITDELVTAAEEYGMALVAVDPKSESADGIITIGATNWAGASAATNHLVDLGHRRIAFAGLDPSAEYAAERFSGFRSVIERAGGTVNPEYIGYGSAEFEAGQRIGAKLCELDEPPTAVVAVCDAVALGVIEAARRHGLSTPDDISVVGFDNTQPAQWSTPMLTTVQQPLARMGVLGMRTLVDLMSGVQPASPHVQLATSLVVRDSTRRLAG